MKKKTPKERVLEVSKELFRKQGFNSTGINQIIKESNVAKASFYDHFKSKNDLAVEYLKQRHTYWFEQLNSFVEKANNANEKARSANLAFYVDYLKFLSNFNNAINNEIKIIASIEDIKFTPFRIIMLDNYIIIDYFSK